MIAEIIWKYGKNFCQSVRKYFDQRQRQTARDLRQALITRRSPGDRQIQNSETSKRRQAPDRENRRVDREK